MMAHHRVDCGDLPVELTLSVFQPGAGPVEVNLMAMVTRVLPLAEQVGLLSRLYEQALESLGLDRSTAVFRRLFCSDPANQAEQLLTSPLLADDCATSWVGQAPVGPGKVALWAYHLGDPRGPLATSRDGATFALHRDTLTHYWTTGLAAAQAPDAYSQSEAVIKAYVDILGGRALTLADHLVRTWFFVRDIDVNYQGLVKARRELFDIHGLTADTHYTASSGIGGESANTRALVFLDAWSIAGVRPEQIRYLKARDHLSPTNTYGVTFERGTAIGYRDRTHALISGTASIDERGRILHPGNVERQLERTLENVEALLAEAGATGVDMSHWIVYLRDVSDEPLIRARMRQRYGDAPMVFLDAPVCRPGWLVEVEGIAMVPGDYPAFPHF
mgnify:CR=1 FL=1